MGDLLTSHESFSSSRQDLFKLLLHKKGLRRAHDQPIPPRNLIDPCPLSFAQQRLWFLDQLEPANAAYTISTILRLHGPLDPATLQRCFTALISRHEILRTTFAPRSAEDGQPVQMIHPPQPLPLPVTDLQTLPADQRAQVVERLSHAEAEQPFDLQHGPLIRARLLRCAPTEHLLVLTLHHIIADGWSMGVLAHELLTLYQALSQDRPPVLAPLPIQYADYAIWQRRWLQGGVLDQQLAYWQQQLKDAPAVLGLPTDRPRPAARSFRGATYAFEVSAALTEQISTLSQRAGVTLFMTLLAAFKVLLHRYSGQPDILVGTPVAGRVRTETEALIGLFVNTLVLRTDLGGDPSCWELLQQVREACLQGYAHQDVPFERLLEAVHHTRELSYTPLFQVMFILQNMPAETLAAHSLCLEVLESSSDTAKFDLSLSLKETGQGLVGALEYSTDLFDATTIARMMAHYQLLLQAFVATPDQRISRLPLLTTEERHRLLVEWNDTAAAYPAEQTLHGLFAAQAARMPDAVAVVFEGERLTYRALNERANRLAHALQALGIEPEQRVGLCVERSLDLPVALLGILKAGAAYVPLDPSYPRERLQLMIDDAALAVIVTQARLAATLPEHHAQIVVVDQPLPSCSTDDPRLAVAPDQLAYVIYTSGSTGRPKALCGPHRGVVNRLHWLWTTYPFRPGEVCCQKTALSFIDSVAELFGPLLRGIPLVIVPDERLKDPDAFVRLLAEAAVTRLVLVPSLLTVILETQPDLQRRLPQLRLWISSGEPLSARLAQEFRRALPEAVLLNLYGMSEAAADSTWYEASGTLSATAVPVGRPLANTQIYLLDAQLEPVPIGVPGELYIGGDGLARGYLARPDLTAERFVPNPFAQERLEIGDWRLRSAQSPISNLQSPISNRLYRTGDLGRYRPDGTIELLGRSDQQVKIRGVRVEVGEVEAAIGRHAAVEQAAVLAVRSPTGEQRLVAYVVARAGQTLSVGELRTFLQTQVPSALVPAGFLLLERLPRLPNGKLDRQRLPAIPVGQPDAAAAFVAPRTPIEQTLAAIWADVLRVERVGVHDNFFARGGDSLLTIQVIARARQAGLHFYPRQLFSHQTIAELAAVEGAAPLAEEPQGLVTGPVPLSPVQQRWFELEPAAPQHWNLSFMLEVHQAVDPLLLGQAVQQVLLHHDALRLRFVRDEHGWQQSIAEPPPTPPVQTIDLSQLDPAEQSPAIERAAAAAQASLSLNEGRVFQIVFFDLGPQRTGRLLVIVNHVVSDGASLPIVLEDLATAYQQLHAGQPVQLPPKTTSLQRWSEQQRSYAQSAALRHEAAYWLDASRAQVARLPLDKRGGRITEQSARTLRLSLSTEETAVLAGPVAEQTHARIPDMILAGLVHALTGWTSGRTWLIDMVSHGRQTIFDDLDVSRTVGWLVVHFPLLVQLAEAASPAHALEAVSASLATVPSLGVGYGLLRYMSGDAVLKRQLEALPQPEILFNYLGGALRSAPDSAAEAQPFQPARESVGPTGVHKNIPHIHLLCNGELSENRLHVLWTYSVDTYRASTIERLAHGHMDALRAIIAANQENQ